MRNKILEQNETLEEYNGYNVVLTFKNNKRLLNNEEINEITEQINDEIYGGAVSPDVKWKAWIVK